MVEGDGYRCWLVDECFTTVVNRDKTIVLDILVDKAHNEALSYNGVPELSIALLASTKELRLIVVVALYECRNLTRKHRYEVVNLELIANALQCLEGELHLALSLDLWLRVAAVIAVLAIILLVLLAEVVEQ